MKKKLILVEHLTCQSKQYEVVRIENSVQYSIGDILPVSSVQRIIDSTQWLVQVIGTKK